MVRPRFGAVGRHGSIAIIERFHRTLKEQGLRKILIPYAIEDFQGELDVFTSWYNSVRPHSALQAATPDEIFSGSSPPLSRTRIEVRPKYPISADALASGTVVRLETVRLEAASFQRRKHLPDVKLHAA